MAILAKEGQLSREAHAMMLNLGHILGQGLGKDSKVILEPILTKPEWKGEGIGSHELNQIKDYLEEISRKHKALELEELSLDEDEDLAKVIKLNLGEDDEECYTFEEIVIPRNGRG